MRKYEHIENTYQDDGVNWALEHDKGEEWCCQVKIDGANFQIALEKNDDGSVKVSYGSRNQEVPLGSDFNGCFATMERIGAEEKCKAILADIGSKYAVVYGELCGGIYRHPDVPRDPKAVRIQGRIDYSPRNEWIVFDIFADGQYLGPDEVERLCKAHDLPVVKTAFKGSLKECLEYPIEFQDKTGNELWGYPLIDGNTAEGVVIKPMQNMTDDRGNRLVFKNKNPKFKERIRATKNAETQGLHPLEEEWKNRYEEYLTESRVYSSLSKLGMNAEFGELMKSFIEDAEADFREDNKAELDKIERTMDPKDFSFKKIRKFANKKACQAVKSVWLKNRKS